MEMKVVYTGGKRFEAIGRGHRVVSDQPLDSGGTDQGMTPPELFLASLGTCAAFYAAEYLNARNLPAGGLEVHVSGEKGGKPVRIASIQVNVIAPGADTDERHKEGLKRAVGRCLIHNTLVALPHIEISIGTGVPEVTALQLSV
jgi:putative redox protein